MSHIVHAAIVTVPHVGQLDEPFRTVLLPIEHCIDFMMISDVRHETVIGEDAVVDVAGIHAAVIQMTGPPGPGTGCHTAAGRGWQVPGSRSGTASGSGRKFSSGGLYNSKGII